MGRGSGQAAQTTKTQPRRAVQESQSKLNFKTIDIAKGETRLTELLQKRADYLKSGAADDFDDPLEQAMAKTYWELTMDANEVKSGGFRTVFIFDNHVVKMPYKAPNERLRKHKDIQHFGSLVSQYTEIEQAKEELAIPAAEMELVYNEAGIPLVVMERVNIPEVDPIDNWEELGFTKETLAEMIENEELYTQIGRNKNGDLVLFDLGDFWQEHLAWYEPGKYGPELREKLPKGLVQEIDRTHLNNIFG